MPGLWLSLDAIRISYGCYVCTPPWGCLRWPATPRESTGPLLYWKSFGYRSYTHTITHTHTPTPTRAHTTHTHGFCWKRRQRSLQRVALQTRSLVPTAAATTDPYLWRDQLGCAAWQGAVFPAEGTTFRRQQASKQDTQTYSPTHTDTRRHADAIYSHADTYMHACMCTHIHKNTNTDAYMHRHTSANPFVNPYMRDWW